jgi:hypothetical protein
MYNMMAQCNPKDPNFSNNSVMHLSEISYIENENDECRIPSQEILGTYAIACVEAMIDTVSDPAQSNPDTVCTLMMVGHAVYLPAAALALASLVGCPSGSEKVILETNTKEAEGYLIGIEGGNVQYLSRDE